MPPNARPSEPAPPVRVAAGTTALDALREAGVELTGPQGAVVVRDADGVLRDLDWAPEADTEVEPVPADSPDGLAVLRHSAAHAMAQAVQDLFPGTLLGIGPPIEDGFYYDFLPSRPFTPDDLAAIEKKMGEIIKSGQRFARRPIGDDAARDELKDEKFKLELIGLKSTRVRGRRRTEVGAGGAHHVRQPRREDRRAGLDRPVPRPAPAQHPAHPRVQADAQRRRLLARRREQRAVAAHLRHRLGEPGRPEGLPEPARGGRQARPPPARRRARPVQLPGRAGLRAARSSTRRAASCAG